METNAVAITNSELKGDVTSCKIETLKFSTERKGVFSPTQKITYQNYDVCTKNVVNTYSVPEINVGFIALLFTIALAICVGVLIICSIIDNL